MIYSMTAFARAAVDAHGRHLVWELKSVNHRFLETHFRLPEALRSIEHPLRELARKHLMALFSVEEGSIERLGAAETKEMLDKVRAAVTDLRAAGSPSQSVPKP